MDIEAELLENLGLKDKRHLALRLRKGLYGLKQSGRLWNLMLHDILKSLDFSQSYTDSCLYIQENVMGKPLVGIYVDDVYLRITDGRSVS